MVPCNLAEKKRQREEGATRCRIFAGQALESYEPVTRRLRLNGHSTSIRLERRFLGILDRMAAREGMTTPAFVSRLHDEVLALHGQAPNFASLLRCACLIDVARGEGPAFAIAAE